MNRVSIEYREPADPETFAVRYRSEHVPIASRLPGLQRYTLSVPRGKAPSLPVLVAELWFADAESMKQALGSPEMAEAAEHADTLGASLTVFTAQIEDVLG